MGKPILCLDFDGVLHLYSSGWKGAACIQDPPVRGAMAFLVAAVDKFQVAIFSSRSSDEFGIRAMWDWLRKHLTDHLKNELSAENILRQIDFPKSKPAAFVTLDDRAVTFSGVFPPVEDLLKFKTWMENPAGSSEMAFPSERPRTGVWVAVDVAPGAWGWSWIGDDLADAIRRSEMQKQGGDLF